MNAAQKFGVVLVAIVLLVFFPKNTNAQDPDLSLRRGFRAVQLGLTFAEAEDALRGDSAFQYRGRPDVSMALSDGQEQIDTRGRGYVDRGLQAFHNGRVYNISLYLNQQRVDYFQLFEQLRTRYGDPVDLDPQRAIWEDETTRIELERPLTVQYLDLAVFRERRGQARTREAVEDTTREAFLEEF
jgi:hypothetical protein